MDQVRLLSDLDLPISVLSLRGRRHHAEYVAVAPEAGHLGDAKLDHLRRLPPTHTTKKLTQHSKYVSQKRCSSQDAGRMCTHGVSKTDAGGHETRFVLLPNMRACASYRGQHITRRETVRLARALTNRARHRLQEPNRHAKHILHVPLARHSTRPKRRRTRWRAENEWEELP